MKKILVPLDFSDSSIAALEIAASVAKRSRGKLYLLNVIPDPQYYFIMPDYGATTGLASAEKNKFVSQLQDKAYSRLRKLRTSVFMWAVPSEPKVLTSSCIYKEILEYSGIIKSDLIVMGTKGTNRLIKIIIGTNAERIIRFTDKPVIVIEKKAKKPFFRNVVFPSEFKPGEAGVVFRTLKKITSLYASRIHLLRINTPDDFHRTEDAIGQMRAFSKKHRGKFLIETRDAYEVDEGIVKYAKQVNADLIAIGLHRKKGPSRFLTNRIAEGILRLSTIPLMAIDIS